MANPLLDVYSPLPLKIAYGKENYLYTNDCEKYLDTYSGIAVNILGHQHPALNDALTSQASQFLHLSNSFETDNHKRLAQTLIEHSNASKVFFSNSGTEANEAALKLVRKWGNAISANKTDIISVTGSFHGRSSAGMALSGSLASRANFKPTLEGISHVAFNDSTALKSMVNENTCAIFLELVYGSGGLGMLSDAFLNTVQTLAKAHNVLIVVDEIQTGLYRTGPFLAYQDTTLKPDIITLAKGIGGGLPLGATLIHERIQAVLRQGDHGSTFGGNPLAVALGNALIDVIDDPLFQQNVKTLMTYLDEALKDLQSRYPNIIHALKGKGFMRGIDVAQHAHYIKETALKNHVLINIVQGTTIRLLPALTFSKANIDELITVLDKILNTIE